MAREARKYMLRLSQELICQDVCHQPFKSGLIDERHKFFGIVLSLSEGA
jgi:hypothetical protein